MPFSLPRRRLQPAVSSPLVVLALILTCQLMIILDVSIVITALPNISASLHFSPTGLSWVQNAYTLAFGGLLLLGARIGDIFGRRRVFVAGVGVFTVASLFAGLAQSAPELLVARSVQGLAAAVAAPSTLALLMLTFQEARGRARAIALYSSISGAGSSVGLVVGGLLTEALSWRWGFFINVPIGITLVVLSPRYLPETEPRPGRFDLAGALTSTLGMTALVYGFVRAASAGWSNGLTVTSFAAGAGLLALFVANEARAAQPITPLRLFTERTRAGSYAARLLLVGGMFSFFFFVSQYLQGVRDYSPLKAGFAFLPMTLVMFAMVQVAPRLSVRMSQTGQVAAGLLLALAGMAWLSRLGVGTAFFPSIALPMVLLGLGIGTAFIPLTNLSIDGVAPEDAGAASGLVNVAQQIGGTLGLAVLVNVFSAASTHATGTARDHLAHGVSSALTGSACFIVAALAITLLTRPRRRPQAAERAGEWRTDELTENLVQLDTSEPLATRPDPGDAVQLAVHYANFTRPGGPEAIAPTLAATARAAEQGGATTFTLMDHWFQMEQMAPATDPMLEGYTGLGFLAGQTERISLGLLVTGVTYRHPGLLAKTVTTLDVLSGGRALFGIGAAWYEREHLGLGVPFPPLATRFEQLEEALQIARQMWSGDNGPYEGRHYQLAETICVPPPIQQPPPVMIGGTGERKTLRLAAEYADIVNWAVADPAEAAHKLDVLRGHCEDVGRDLDSIELTIIGASNPLADPDGFLREMQAYAEVGIDTVFVAAQTDDPAGWVTQVCDRFVEPLRELD